MPENQRNAYECNCRCFSSPVILRRTIGASSDDAEQEVLSGAMSLDGDHLDMTAADGESNGAQQLVGLRFRAIGIPRGSTILSAVIQFSPSRTAAMPSLFTLQAQNADDAAPFSATDFDISNRPRTTAQVLWNPPIWQANGPTQVSPDLSPVLQEIIDRPGWTPFGAIAIIISGTGNRSASSFDGDAGEAPVLVVQYAETSVNHALPVCMRAEDNPNLNGGVVPDAAALQNDCSVRVADTLSGLSAACNYPPLCICNADTPPVRLFSTQCNETCDPVPLSVMCGNFNPETGNTTATNVPGDLPVCLIDDSPMSSRLYGQRSTCQVTGTGTLATDDESVSSAARGTLEIVGAPCPGQSCAVGVSYQLGMDDVTFGGLFGSATFSQLAGVGRTASGSFALIAADGSGVLAPDTTVNSARGQRDNGDVLALAATNDNAIDLGVDWQPGSASCSLSGALLGSVDPEQRRCENAGPHANQLCQADADCGSAEGCSGPQNACLCQQVASADANVALSVSGPMVNQPPLARAGADQTVECDRPGAARVVLDGSASFDADGNYASFRWMRDDRAGPVVGFQPVVELVQSLGAATPYVLRVLDTAGQGDEDTTVVTVADTTAPVISCNAPASIRPPSTPFSFAATAQDVCDAAVVPVITAIECFRVNGSGRVVDLSHSCKATAEGNVLHLKHSNGVGTQIRWTVQAADASGNLAERTCHLVVTN